MQFYFNTELYIHSFQCFKYNIILYTTYACFRDVEHNSLTYIIRFMTYIIRFILHQFFLLQFLQEWNPQCKPRAKCTLLIGWYMLVIYEYMLHSHSL